MSGARSAGPGFRQALWNTDAGDADPTVAHPVVDVEAIRIAGIVRNARVGDFGVRARLGEFSSDSPLFEEARGACPFVSPAIYVDTREEGGGAILFETEGTYCRFTDTSGSKARALFVPIERNWWIVQSDEPRPIYTLVQRRGTQLLQYQPLCSDFPAQRLTALGVSFNEDQSVCSATRASQVETLFRSWRSPLRQPTSVLRHERDAWPTV
jgi:hypothetical protein